VAQQAYAYVTLIPVAEGFQKAIAKEMGGVGNVGKKAGDELGKGTSGGFGSAIKGLAGLIAGVFTVNAIKNFTKDSIMAAEAVSTANARIVAVADAMGTFGSETGAVTDRLIDFAKSNEILLAVDENVIKATQAKLLTFGELAATADEAGGAFDRATLAAIDLEAAGFGPAESQAVALGKALNDPTKGLAALGKSGITFTDAEKDKIAALQESGDLLGAQEILLGAIEGQVKGTAAATADASVQMGLAFGNIKEAVGDELLPIFNDLVKEMLPVIDEVIPVFGETIQALAPIIKDLAGQFPDLMRALFPVIPIIGELAGIFLDIAAKILPIVVDLFDKLMPAIADLLPIVADFIADALEVLVPILVDLIDALIPIVMALLPVFMDLFKALAPVAIRLIDAMLPLINLVLPILIRFIEFLTPILVNVANIMGDVMVKAVELLMRAIQFVTDRIDVFANFFRNTWDGIKSFFGTIINGLIAGFEGFVNGAIRGVNRVIDAINSLSFTIPDWVPEVGGKSFGFNLRRLAEIALPRVALADGGVVTKPTQALIGEAGPEVVIPLDRFERMVSMSDEGGSTVNYYAAPNKSFDAEQELQLAMRRVRILA
jgi:phage-related protein